MRNHIFFLLFISVANAHSAEIAITPALSSPWKKHTIQRPALQSINSAVANDWDKDGHIDVLSSFEGKVILYQGPDWKPHPVFTFAPGNSRNNPRDGCIHSCLMDVDDDGDLDLIGSNNTVFWLECPDDPFSEKPWTYRTVDDEILGTHCLITGDVNKDGRLDLIANSGRAEKQTKFPNSLTWLEIPIDPHTAKSWKRHVFADKDAPGGSHYAGFGDVNKDGRPDIAYGAKGGNGFEGGEWFAWWEQPKDPTAVWKKHILSNDQPGATNIIPADFDKDGHVDYFATRGHGKGALLFKGSEFKPVEIDPDIVFPHSLALADLDGDGDTDAATCGKEADGVAAWYENDGKANFTKHVIGTDQGSYDTRTIDMDGDGDLDLLIAGHSSRNIVWFENPNKAPSPPKPKPLPKSPAESLASIHVPEGYKVELVVSEPDVMDPVAIDWDARGRLWVVEMADYPLGLDDKGKPGGRIRVLEDADRDGKYEKNTVFLEGLTYPQGIKTWRNGVLITAAPDIIYAEDTDGDDKADRVETWFTGFAEGNQQLRVNGLRWSVDGWLHLANGKSGGTIYATDKPDHKIDIRNYDVRIRPDSRTIEATTGRTQFGITFDKFGQRFGCDNSLLAWHVVLEERHLRRNPHVSYPPAIVQLVPQRNPPVYPRSKLKTRIHADYMANRFTSACGLCLYRDEFLFGGHDRIDQALLIKPPKIQHLFVCEPVHNVVTRRILNRESFKVTYSARRDESEELSEFMASDDNWFRPVMARTGPDGALWIVDMYRDIVEHPHWVPKAIRATWEKEADLRAGHDRGRIYRVTDRRIRQVKEGKLRRFTRELPPVPEFHKLTPPHLVDLLAHQNGTVRDIAQQQLMWNETEESKKLVRAVLADPKAGSRARLHALGCLSKSPTSSDLSHVANSKDPGVVALAFRLTEALPEGDPFPSALTEISDPKSILISSVYIDAVTALGAPRWSPENGEILARFAVAIEDDLPDVDYRIAALQTTLPTNLEPISDALAKANFPHPALVANTLITADKMGKFAGVRTLAERVVTPSGTGKFHPWQFQAAAAFGKPLPDSEKILAEAALIATDRAKPPADRTAAISLLGIAGGNTDDLVALLEKLFSGAEPENADVKDAALKALTRKSNPRVPTVLINAWNRLSPAHRSHSIDFLLRRTPSTKRLLDSIKEGNVTVAEIDTARRKRLLGHKDESVRTLAKSLFQNPDADRAKVVAAHRDALDLKADAKHGKEIFALHCAICHELEGIGNAIGPDLRSVTDRSPVGLLTSILDPTAQMEPIYQGYVCETVTGEFHTGLVVGESGGGVEIVGMDAKRHAIPGSDIKSLKGTGKSFMPEGLETAMSKQDLADLIRYLGYPE